jgi:hypothetical protein
VKSTTRLFFGCCCEYRTAQKHSEIPKALCWFNWALIQTRFFFSLSRSNEKIIIIKLLGLGLYININEKKKCISTFQCFLSLFFVVLIRLWLSFFLFVSFGLYLYSFMLFASVSLYLLVQSLKKIRIIFFKWLFLSYFVPCD